MSESQVQFFPYKGEKLPENFQYDQEYKPLIDFFNKKAKKCTKELVSKVFIIRDSDNNFVGFVAFSIKSITKEMLNQSKCGGLYDRPAIVIGQLMIDKRYQSKKYGRTVIKFAVSMARRMNKILPCRLLVVEAFNEKSRQYYIDKTDFEPTVGDPDFLVMDLKPILGS